MWLRSKPGLGRFFGPINFRRSAYRNSIFLVSMYPANRNLITRVDMWAHLESQRRWPGDPLCDAMSGECHLVLNLV